MLVSLLQQYPRMVSSIGAIAGWASFDLLRSAQIVAAVLAGLVSLCALILTAPSAVAKVKGWFSKSGSL